MISVCGCPHREPLPYPHEPDVNPLYKDLPFACARPESPDLYMNSRSNCSGCLAWATTLAVHKPDEIVWSTETRAQQIRRVLDADHPMRVLFERELARRGCPHREGAE